MAASAPSLTGSEGCWGGAGVSRPERGRGTGAVPSQSPAAPPVGPGLAPWGAQGPVGVQPCQGQPHGKGVGFLEEHGPRETRIPSKREMGCVWARLQGRRSLGLVSHQKEPPDVGH